MTQPQDPKNSVETSGGAQIEGDPDYALAYNNRCWLHALWQEPEKALPDCETAINKASPSKMPHYRDSRGITYALLGETDKAVADFQAFVEAFENDSAYGALVPKRKAWIESLQAGENPFTPEVLEELRHE